MGESNRASDKAKSKSSTVRVVLIVMGVLALFRIVGREVDRVSTDRAYAEPAALSSKHFTREGANEALIHAKAAASMLESHFKQHASFPISLAAAEFNRPLPEAVQSIRVEANGTLRVVLMGSGRQELRSFWLHPKVDSGGKFDWTCVHEEMPFGILPSECSRRNNDG